MAPICDLIRWIITYAVEGGFWHFVAVYGITVAIARIFNLVRVNLTTKRKSKPANANGKAEAA
jgi:hypothetical protein